MLSGFTGLLWKAGAFIVGVVTVVALCMMGINGITGNKTSSVKLIVHGSGSFFQAAGAAATSLAYSVSQFGDGSDKATKVICAEDPKSERCKTDDAKADAN